MNIIVLIKQVLNSDKVEFSRQMGTGIYTLVRDGVDSIMNYDDGNALEMALQWKEKNTNTHITVLCMGARNAEDILRECLALGVDNAVLLTDERLVGADTVATATYLSYAVKKIGNYDIILTGYQSQDGRTGQVGPMVAEKLGIPQLTYVRSFYKDAEKLVGIRELGEIDEKTAVDQPCVITISKQKYGLRAMTISGIRKALKKEVHIWNLDDICSEKEHKETCLARSIAVEIEKVERTRKKKIIKFEDCQNHAEILEDIIREAQKCDP